MTTVIERSGFRIVLRGSPGRLIAAEYECPCHGRWAIDVPRGADGDPPATHLCPDGTPAEYRISKSGTARPRLFEVVKGKPEPKQRKTWMDTRDMGDGQSLEEFREVRAAIWDEKRRQDLSDLIKDGPNPAF